MITLGILSRRFFHRTGSQDVRNFSSVALAEGLLAILSVQFGVSEPKKCQHAVTAVMKICGAPASLNVRQESQSVAAQSTSITPYPKNVWRRFPTKASTNSRRGLLHDAKTNEDGLRIRAHPSTGMEQHSAPPLPPWSPTWSRAKSSIIHPHVPMFRQTMASNQCRGTGEPKSGSVKWKHLHYQQSPGSSVILGRPRILHLVMSGQKGAIEGTCSGILHAVASDMDYGYDRCVFASKMCLPPIAAMQPQTTRGPPRTAAGSSAVREPTVNPVMVSILFAPIS
eukprot:SAG31_NODE_3265_length_4480_cov_19.931066_3_plen_282_part_00